MTPSDSAPIDPIALLRALVKCPSVTPEEAGVLDLLETFLRAHGFSVERLAFQGDGSYPVDNLFATMGGDGPHLLFAGHTDVVPTGPEADWTHPPFAAEIVEDTLYGRGAVDMKSGVAAMCVAAARAAAEGALGNGRISLAITNDEEADGVNGTEKVMQWADARGHKFDFSIVGEPSSEKKLGDRVKIGRRGSLNGRIIVSGRQGHSAYPEEALNPLPVLAAIAQKLAHTPLDEGSAAFQPSTLALTNFDVGNTATNVIPGKGVLAFNIRFNDLWSDDKLVAWVKARLAEVDTMGCAVDFLYPARNSQSFVCPPGGGVALLDEVIAQFVGQKPQHSTTGGTSDARFITRYCPVVECGLVGATMHQVDERVALDDVHGLTEIYARFIARFMAGSPASSMPGSKPGSKPRFNEDGKTGADAG